MSIFIFIFQINSYVHQYIKIYNKNSMEKFKTNKNCTIKSTSTMRKLDLLLQKINEKIHQSLLAGGRKKLGMAPQPGNLIGGQLKNYQRQSLAWMCELAQHKLNGILADDMGLGKTIQTISYLCYLSEQKKIKGKHLIVVPKNVLNNWKRQIQRWSKDHCAVILPGTQLQRQEVINKIVKQKKFDVLICTYQSVQKEQTQLSKFFWQTLIVDEAHSIKNQQTYLAMCLRRYRAKFKLLLTGTPLSNQLKQLWSLLNFILPEIFYDSEFFDEIEDCANDQNKDQQQKKQFQMIVAQKFQKLLKPFLLRRNKNEINLGLKQKKEITLFVSMTELQLKMYKNYLKCRSVYGDPNLTQSGRAIQLRKICNHPYLFPEIQNPQHPAYGEHLIENSGKMILLDKLLKKLLRQNHKILIFSQFVTVLKILEDYLTYREYDYCFITGQTSLQGRQNQLQQFNESKQKNVFLISTRAGGIGLNLVAADIVIIFDIDWNPQMDRQAMDRAYRIGQKNSVKVFKFITMSTIQQRMLEIQKYKLIWDELVIQKGGLVKVNNSGEDKFNKIDYDKLADIGAQEIFRIQNKFDDKTIEEIIKYGEEKDEQKTKQIRQKLYKQFENLYNNNTEDNILLGNASSLKDIQYQRQKVGYVKSSRQQTKAVPSKYKKYIKPEPYHLFSNQKLAGQLLYQLNQTEEKISQDRKQQINRQLNQLGFYNWTNEQYKLFIDANMRILKDDYKKIASEIPTKSIKEVKNYSEAYYEKVKINKGTLHGSKSVLTKQDELKIQKQVQQNKKKIKKIPRQLLTKETKFTKNLINKNAINFLQVNDITQKGPSYEQMRYIFTEWFPKVSSKAQKSTINREHKFLTSLIQDYNKNNIQSEGVKILEKEYDQLKSRIKKLEQNRQKNSKDEINIKNKKNRTKIAKEQQICNDSADTEIKS